MNLHDLFSSLGLGSLLEHPPGPSALTPLHGDPAFFWAVVIGVGGLLALSGTVLALLRVVLRKPLPGVWATWRGWWLIIPPALLMIALGRAATIIALVFLGAYGFKEYARATGLYRDWPATLVVYAGMFGLGAVALAYDPRLHVPGWYGMFMALPVYVIALIFLVPIARNRAKGQLQGVALAVLGFVYIGWMFLHLAFLANLEHALHYVLYLLLAVPINDVAAFSFGRLFGRARFRDQISPNKTWAGALGALLVSLALPWLLRGALPHFGPLQLVLTGLIVGVGGQLGDLSISFVKRDVGVKDMGALIPGHGGVLDRIDSLIYTAPLFFHMVRWFYGAGAPT